MVGVLAVGLAAMTACGSGGTPSGGTETPDTAEGQLGDVGAPPPPAGVSVIVDRKTLMLPDGKTIAVDKIPGGALDGFQTRDGWLLRGYGDGRETNSLWLVTADGALRSLVDKAQAPVAVAPDGRHIAWRSGDKLYTGTIDPKAGLTVGKTSPAPERGSPFLMTNDSVVLAYSETGGGLDHHDVWFPALGDYKPTWEKTKHIFTMYGVAPGGSNYLGQVHGPGGEKDSCLAELDPKQNLKAIRTACGIVTQIDYFGAVSPDGKWFAYHGAGDDGRGRIEVVDLSSVFTKPAISVAWKAELIGAWEDGTTMLAHGLDGGLVRLRLGSADGEVVDRPGLAKNANVVLLPRLL
jgi:hypothetical protein